MRGCSRMKAVDGCAVAIAAAIAEAIPDAVSDAFSVAIPETDTVDGVSAIPTLASLASLVAPLSRGRLCPPRATAAGVATLLLIPELALEASLSVALSVTLSVTQAVTQAGAGCTVIGDRPSTEAVRVVARGVVFE